MIANFNILNNRYTRAERELRAARPYGEGAVQFYEKAEVIIIYLSYFNILFLNFELNTYL